MMLIHLIRVGEMMDNTDLQAQRLKNKFPFFVNEKDEHLCRLVKKSRLINVEAKQKVLTQGAICKDYLLVTEGRVRVQFLTRSRSGRERVLYHVHSGEDCVLTTSCLFTDDGFPVEGIAETEVSVIAIPATVFHETLKKSEAFQQFVFSALEKRLSEVISRMETLCTLSVEHQLAKVLLLMGRDSPVIKITHQELASEVGTAREVVSRCLKKFEKNRWVKLGRKKIQLRDRLGLQALLSE